MKPITILLFITLLGCSSASGQDTTKSKIHPVTSGKYKGSIPISVRTEPSYNNVTILDSAGPVAFRDSLGNWIIYDCKKALEVLYQEIKKKK